jgi:hypothetical protein
MPTREQVFTALEALLTTVPGINTVTRRMTMPSEFSTADDTRLPILMIWEQNEKTEQRGRGTPATRTWEAFLVVYFRNPDIGGPNVDASTLTPGATIINPILEGIEAALEPPPVSPNTQTLGGLVSHCWIEGITTVALGDVDTQGFGGCVVPVKILVP